MPTLRKIYLLVAVLSFVLLVAWVSPAQSQNGCTTYHNSRLWLFGSTWACAFSGSACTECVSPGGECYWDSGGGIPACNIHPENRW